MSDVGLNNGREETNQNGHGREETNQNGHGREETNQNGHGREETNQNVHGREETNQNGHGREETNQNGHGRHGKRDESTELEKIVTQEREPEKYHRIVELCAIICSVIPVFIFFPFSLFVCLKFVREYERAVIFRLGILRKGKALGPGIFFVLPCIDEYTKVDTRIETFSIPPQETLTKDSTSVSVDGVVYFRVIDPLKAVLQVMNHQSATRFVSATTLRNVIGTVGLIELLMERVRIAKQLKEIVDRATFPWGIIILRVELKDVRLPVEMQRAMAAEAEAKRVAVAKVVQAEGELNAAKMLREAAEIIAEAPAALQLRYLQTLSSISSERNTTIIFPFPMEFAEMFKK